jgi:hypothetical protein
MLPDSSSRCEVVWSVLRRVWSSPSLPHTRLTTSHFPRAGRALPRRHTNTQWHRDAQRMPGLHAIDNFPPLIFSREYSSTLDDVDVQSGWVARKQGMSMFLFTRNVLAYSHSSMLFMLTTVSWQCIQHNVIELIDECISR